MPQRNYMQLELLARQRARALLVEEEVGGSTHSCHHQAGAAGETASCFVGGVSGDEHEEI
jgi:hypothetical protein